MIGLNSAVAGRAYSPSKEFSSLNNERAPVPGNRFSPPTHCDEFYPPPEAANVSTKHRIHYLFESPQGSKLGMAINIWILILILASTTALFLQSLPSIYEKDRPYDSPWFILESFAIINFSIEYLVRLFTAPNKAQFAFRFHNVVDLLAILPYYLELVLRGSDVQFTALIIMRAVRLTRVLRVFKLASWAHSLNLMKRAMSVSRDALLLLMFLLVIAVVIMSAAVYYAEIGSCEFNEDEERWYYKQGQENPVFDGTFCPFQSIPSTAWYVIVSIMGVGYGDVYPISVTGKMMGTVTMLSGVFIIAFPVTILSASFSDVWEEQKRLNIKRKHNSLQQQGLSLRELLQLLQFEASTLNVTFNQLQNVISEQEVRLALFHDAIAAIAAGVESRAFDQSVLAKAPSITISPSSEEKSELQTLTPLPDPAKPTEVPPSPTNLRTPVALNPSSANNHPTMSP